jgi:hypothetical protein
MNSASKRCSHCGITKDAEHFYLRKRGIKAGYLSSYCRECEISRSRAARESRKANPLCTTEKQCRDCGLVLPADQFTVCWSYGDNLRSSCKPCAAFRGKLQTYGFTDESFAQLFESQGGCCALCRRGFEGYRSTDVDHDHNAPCITVLGDHKSREGCPQCVRGLVCQSCNAYLRWYEQSDVRDDPIKNEYLASRPLARV